MYSCSCRLCVIFVWFLIVEHFARSGLPRKNHSSPFHPLAALLWSACQLLRTDLIRLGTSLAWGRVFADSASGPFFIRSHVKRLLQVSRRGTYQLNVPKPVQNLQGLDYQNVDQVGFEQAGLFVGLFIQSTHRCFHGYHYIGTWKRSTEKHSESFWKLAVNHVNPESSEAKSFSPLPGLRCRSYEGHSPEYQRNLAETAPCDV